MVQIMACHLDGAKPLSEPMLEYNDLNETTFAENVLSLEK